MEHRHCPVCVHSSFLDQPLHPIELPSTSHPSPANHGTIHHQRQGAWQPSRPRLIVRRLTVTVRVGVGIRVTRILVPRGVAGGEVV